MKRKTTSCSILKKRISKATTPKTRGKALGDAMKAKCFKRKKKRH